jgi:hypothetical protein
MTAHDRFPTNHDPADLAPDDAAAGDVFPGAGESGYPPPAPPGGPRGDATTDPVITVTTPTEPPTLDRPAARALLALLIHLAADTAEADPHPVEDPP